LRTLLLVAVAAGVIAALALLMPMQRAQKQPALGQAPRTGQAPEWAAIGPYTTLVYKDGEETVAVDSLGRVIARSRDATEVLSAAFRRGGVVYVAEGVYEVRGIHVDLGGGSLRVVGAGIDRTVIRQTAQTDVIGITRGNVVELEGFTVDTGGVATAGVVITDTLYTYVRRIRITGDTTKIWHLNVWDVTYDRTRRVHATRLAVIEGVVSDSNRANDDSGITVSFIPKAVVRNCVLYGHSGMGTVLLNWQSEDVTFENNLLFGNSKHADIGSDTRDVPTAVFRAVNNYIVNSSSIFGIRVWVSSRAILTGNRIEGVGGDGIRVIADGMRVDGVIISDNVVRRAGIGISTQEVNNGTIGRLVLEGNLLELNRAQGADVRADYIVAVGNEARSNAREISGYRFGLVLHARAHMYVAGNVAYDDQPVRTQERGIAVATCSKCSPTGIVAGNYSEGGIVYIVDGTVLTSLPPQLSRVQFAGNGP